MNSIFISSNSTVRGAVLGASRRDVSHVLVREEDGSGNPWVWQSYEFLGVYQRCLNVELREKLMKSWWKADEVGETESIRIYRIGLGAGRGLSWAMSTSFKCELETGAELATGVLADPKSHLSKNMAVDFWSFLTMSHHPKRNHWSKSQDWCNLCHSVKNMWVPKRRTLFFGQKWGMSSRNIACHASPVLCFDLNLGDLVVSVQHRRSSAKPLVRS